MKIFSKKYLKKEIYIAIVSEKCQEVTEQKIDTF